MPVFERAKIGILTTTKKHIIQTILLFVFLNQNFALMGYSRGRIGFRICNLIENGVGFVALRAVTMKNTIFWDITPCILAQVYRRHVVTP
jgi:hypothetical protein